MIIHASTRSLSVLFSNDAYHRRCRKGVTNIRITLCLFTRFHSQRIKRCCVTSCSVKRFTTRRYRSFHSINHDRRFMRKLRSAYRRITSKIIIFRCRSFYVQRSFSKDALFRLHLRRNVIFQFKGFCLLRAIYVLVCLLFIGLYIPRLRICSRTTAFTRFTFRASNTIVRLRSALHRYRTSAHAHLTYVHEIRLICLMRTIRCLIRFPNVCTTTNVNCTSSNVTTFNLSTRNSTIFHLNVLSNIKRRIICRFLRLFLIVPCFRTIYFLLRMRTSLFNTNVFRRGRVIFM